MTRKAQSEKHKAKSGSLKIYGGEIDAFDLSSLWRKPESTPPPAEKKIPTNPNRGPRIGSGVTLSRIHHYKNRHKPANGIMTGYCRNPLSTLIISPEER